MRSIRRVRVAVLLVALTLMCRAGISAHDKKSAGSLVLTIGWGDEPAFSGSRNSVDVDAADTAGAPIADPAASLTVDVSFADQHVSLAMRPAFGRPGRFRAMLVPTRPGTYTFHITGSIKGQAVDVTSTCSDKTFACVADASEIQFPAKDPSAGQLADRIDRAIPRAERAADAAGTARIVAIAALAVAVLALGLTLGRGARPGSRRR